MTDKNLKGFDEGLITGMILLPPVRPPKSIQHNQWQNSFLKKTKSGGSLKDELHGFNHIFLKEYFWKFRKLLDYGRILCGVPPGSTLGPLLFLIYANNMPQAVNSNLFLYADDSCLIFQHKDVEEIKKVLDNEFENISNWFVDNKLSIHFGEDKTKSILFANQSKIKNIKKKQYKASELWN